MTENKMVGWHHWVDGHEFEQALGVGDGQGNLACCSPWGYKESEMTEQLNWTEKELKSSKSSKVHRKTKQNKTFFTIFKVWYNYSDNLVNVI